MTWSVDDNTGRCMYQTCSRQGVGPRCGAMACPECCQHLHANWAGHRSAYGHIVLPATTTPPVPVEWDYDKHPPEFGDTEELETGDSDRVFVPLYNYKANKEWPVDYVG